MASSSRRWAVRSRALLTLLVAGCVISVLQSAHAEQAPFVPTPDSAAASPGTSDAPDPDYTPLQAYEQALRLLRSTIRTKPLRTRLVRVPLSPTLPRLQAHRARPARLMPRHPPLPRCGDGFRRSLMPLLIQSRMRAQPRSKAGSKVSARQKATARIAGRGLRSARRSTNRSGPALAHSRSGQTGRRYQKARRPSAPPRAYGRASCSDPSSAGPRHLQTSACPNRPPHTKRSNRPTIQIAARQSHC